MLIDLLIGLSVGALVLGAAIAALLVAREAASTVAEMSLLQQQASHALRMLGLQIRPAGSVELQASPGMAGSFQVAAAAPLPGAGTAVVQGKDGVKGAGDSLRVVRTSSNAPGQQEDCLGQEIAPGERMEASFEVDAKGALRCRGASQPQPLVTGVSGFRLRYRVRQGEQARDLRASEVEAGQLWPEVVAVEVCLDLRGEERSSAHEARYIDCNAQQVTNGGRLHLVTRKLFQLRTRQEN